MFPKVSTASRSLSFIWACSTSVLFLKWLSHRWLIVTDLTGTNGVQKPMYDRRQTLQKHHCCWFLTTPLLTQLIFIIKTLCFHLIVLWSGQFIWISMISFVLVRSAFALYYCFLMVLCFCLFHIVQIHRNDPPL